MHMGGVFLSPTRNLANNNRMKRHVNPWNYPVKTHTYAEWEEEFRDKMKAAGIPLERRTMTNAGTSFVQIELQAAAAATGRDPRSSSARACSATARAQEPELPRPAQPAGLAALRRRLEAAAGLEADHPRGHEGAAGEVPLLPALHGYLRALRRLRRQVPFLHRLRRSEEHAGAAGRAAALGLSPVLHRCRAGSSAGWPARAN